MSYLFIGKLCGYLCADCREPLSQVTVRFYRAERENIERRVSANPKETLQVLDEDAIEKKQSRFIGEVRTDDEGGFSFDFGDKWSLDEAFEIDVYCENVPRSKSEPLKPGKQFTITSLRPAWDKGENGLLARWEYCLPYSFWCRFRALFGAWVICGRLTTCKGKSAIIGATVKAFDADWLQDDPLGTATTGPDGHFRIDYTTASFRRTPLSPFLNFEWVGGPDVYFKAELAGNLILDEGQSHARVPGRENISNCFCVDLCTDEVTGGGPDGGPEAHPHWMQVEVFDIHPAAPNPASSFSPEGYAGGINSSYVFGGSVGLHGNCPLTNFATGNPLKYRFVIGEWGWPGGSDDPTTMPSVAPAALTPVTQIYNTLVGYVSYTNGLGMPDWAQVIVGSGDLVTDADGAGWITIDGRSVTVDMRDGTTSTVVVHSSNFLRTFDLINLNSNAITAVHAPKMPGGLDRSQAGRPLTTAEKEPIRRYTLQFEVLDTVTHTSVAVDTLSSIILDNSPVIVSLNIEELLTSLCNPLAGATEVHLLYTVDHPHLNTFSLSISNNTGVVHPAPLPSVPAGVATHGEFNPSHDFFFRGAASGPHQPDNQGGLEVNIAGDAPCAYMVALSWHTRRYYDVGHSTHMLYCK